MFVYFCHFSHFIKITTLDSGENALLHEHLELAPEQASAQFGGKIEYSWAQYEAELRLIYFSS